MLLMPAATPLSPRRFARRRRAVTLCVRCRALMLYKGHFFAAQIQDYAQRY